MYVRLIDYATLHGVTYQTAYGWVRHGRLIAERRAGKWWVRRDVPRPEGRRADDGRVRVLAAIRARRSPEERRAIARKGGLAASSDRERWRAFQQRGHNSPKHRRNHGPCAVCEERPATARGRCARCFIYWRRYGRERPPVVQRRGPQGRHRSGRPA